MGIIGIISDQLYLKGLIEQNLDCLILAKTIFPFDRDILSGPAQLYYRNKSITKDALKSYKNSLLYDPYSIQLLTIYIQLEYLIGNKNEAIIAKQKLEKIAPNSNALKQINAWMKGLHK